MKRSRITQKEIEDAITQTKGNRAPEEDTIIADMLKADPRESAKALEELFNRIWTSEEVPDSWKKGVIVKLPKKGYI
jgi:hypothetical protein